MVGIDLKEKIEQQEVEADIDKQKDDICPACGLRTANYPYIAFDPIYGWLECPGCGTIFSPLSVRRQKLEAAEKRIKSPKLIVPV